MANVLRNMFFLANRYNSNKQAQNDATKHPIRGNLKNYKRNKEKGHRLMLTIQISDSVSFKETDTV